MAAGKPDIEPISRGAEAAAPRSARVDVHRVDGARAEQGSDLVAIEEPLEIRLGYRAAGERQQRSVSITMRTPGNDVELALGFLHGEGLIARPGDVEHADHCGPPAPGSALSNVVRVELGPGTEVDIDKLQRHFYTTSSCGVCGKTSLEALEVIAQPPPGRDELRIGAEALCALPERLAGHQSVFMDTGGLHAAGLFDGAGNLLEVREDVGRHNALDKLVGALLLSGRLPARGCGVLVSGRASFELVQKAIMAGCAMLAAVGAPSSLAVDLARRFDMSLVGFLRDGRFNVYAGAERIGEGGGS